jgi:hypothetical protein
VATTSSDNSGRFKISVTAGEVTKNVTAEGYIAKTKSVSVTGTIWRGQGADAALSKVLPPGGWRTTVNWDRDPGDVDSHTYFGSNFNTHVYWPSRARTKTASGTGGIKVVLDRDDVNGHGPETTTFLNLGNCKGQGKCLIKFLVKKYSGRVSLPEGHAHITVYKGSEVADEWDAIVPANIGRNQAPMFTLWAGNNPKLYRGAVKEGPYIGGRQRTAKWWGSLDSQQWSQVPDNSLLTGLYRNPSGQADVYAIEEGRYRHIQNNARGTECQTANWWSSFDHEGWSSCPAGYFITGFYRTGNMHDGSHGLHHVEEARCCRPKGGSDKWGTCTEDTMFERNGVSACADGKAIVGLYRSDDNSINGMDKMKCCELDSVLVPV